MSGRRKAYRRGHRAESLCALVLRLKGWRIVARRFSVPVGEIDIIARRGNVLALVEVKARRNMTEALEAVTPRQRQRIERAGEAFLSRYPKWSNLAVRFDLMVVRPGHLPRQIADAWRPEWRT